MQDSTTQLDPTVLQDLLSGSSAPSLIPESLVTTLTIGFIVLNVLGILFLVFYIMSMVRKWKVESAMLKMQKDVADIKAHLATTPSPSTSQTAQPTVQPAEQNRVVAQSSESTDGSRSSGNLS